MPPKRTSNKQHHLLDSMARFLDACIVEHEYVVAVAYHKGTFLISGNSGAGLESALKTLNDLTTRLGTVFINSPGISDLRQQLLSQVQLKDLKIDRLHPTSKSSLGFLEICDKYGYNLTPNESKIFDVYSEQSAQINAYQLLRECAKSNIPRDKKEYWLKKNCTLQEIAELHQTNISLSNFNNDVSKYSQLCADQPKACHKINTWFTGGLVPIVDPSAFIDSWHAVSIIMRNVAKKIQESSAREYGTLDLLNTFSRPVIDAERIIKIYKGDMPESLAMQNGLFEFVPTKDTTHAEMSVLDRVYRDLHIGDELYIGISKLCCGGCYTVIQNFSQIIPNAKILVKGTHYKLYPYVWTPPELLRAHPDVMFKLFTELMKTANEFMESIEPKTSTRTYEFGDLSDYEIDVVEAPSYFA